MGIFGIPFVLYKVSDMIAAEAIILVIVLGVLDQILFVSFVFGKDRIIVLMDFLGIGKLGYFFALDFFFQ